MDIHYRHCPKEFRPKVFGMTASPVAQRTNAFDAIASLEKTLYAEAITAPNLVELSQYLSKPVERFVNYPTSQFFPLPGRYTMLMERFPSLIPFVDSQIGGILPFCDSFGPWTTDRAIELAIVEVKAMLRSKLMSLLYEERMRNRIDFKDPNEDPKFVQMRQEILKESLEALFVNSLDEFNNYDLVFYLHSFPARWKPHDMICNLPLITPFIIKWVDDNSCFIKLKDSTKIQTAHEIINQVHDDTPRLFKLTTYNDENAIRKHFDGINRSKCTSDTDDPYNTLSIDAARDLWRHCNDINAMTEIGIHAKSPMDEEISPRILAVVSLVCEMVTKYDRFCGIIFVEERVIATILNFVLQKHPKLSFIRAAYLIGHGGKSTKFKHSLKMNVLSQKRVIADFKAGRVNLLVATQVAEEGLDIKPCNVVIRFFFINLDLICLTH